MKIESFIIEKIVTNYLRNRYITQKRKKKIYVLDGFIKYPIDIGEKFKCSCGNYLKGICPHILHILISEYKFPMEIAYIMPLLEKSDIKNILDEQFNLIDYLDRVECPICLDNVIIPQKGNNNILQCSYCYNLSHQYCTNRWGKNCSMCRNNL